MKRYEIKIKRQASPDDEPYWETFSYVEKDDRETVAMALLDIAKQTASEGGRPLAWENSCLQKKCGACAAVINGHPALICDKKLDDYRKRQITIEPLKKFPVVEDLIVDRSAMMERLKALSVWFEGEAKETGEAMAFEASKCLQCGLCLEVCPNFMPEGDFAGMAAMAPLSRLIAKLPDTQRGDVEAHYRKAVYEGCGKSLACRDVCPAGIDMDGLLARSNGAAVWRRWREFR